MNCHRLQLVSKLKSNIQCRIKRKAASTLLAMVTLWSTNTSSADAALFPVLEEHEKYTKDLLSGAKWLNGQASVDTALSTAVGLSDYVVETRMTGRMKDKLKEGGARFFYKKKQSVRLEVTKSSNNQGSVIVKHEDGSIEARGGGMLKFMKMNLQANSRILELPSGHSVVYSDITTLLNEVKAKIKAGAKARMASDTLTGNIWKSPVKVIEIVEGPFDTVIERIFLNPKTNLPVAWDFFNKDGTLVSMTFFDNFKSNVGLDENLFKLDSN